MRRVLDIAGVAVELCAGDPARGRILHEAVAGFETTDAEPQVSFALGTTPPAIPERAPDDEYYGRRLWRRPDGVLIIASEDVGVLVDGSRVEGWMRTLDDARLFEPLASMALCWLLARHGRFLLHAAAVGRDGEAVIALGHSGAGKSTLSFVALDAGMEALTDDAAVIVPAPSALLVHGVHQVPNAPSELGGALLDGALQLRDPRDRVALATGVLTTGPWRIVGVVLVGHSERADGDLERLPGHAAMPLLLQSFAALDGPAHRAAYLPVAGRLARLPVWRLSHGTDTATRRLTSGRHLDRCLRESLSAVES